MRIVVCLDDIFDGVDMGLQIKYRIMYSQILYIIALLKFCHCQMPDGSWTLSWETAISTYATFSNRKLSEMA